VNLSDHQKYILEKWPELEKPQGRLPYGYKVKDTDNTRIIPILDVIFVIEDILDQMAEGLSLRDASDQTKIRLPRKYHLSHMGLKVIRNRLRPSDPQFSKAPRKKRPVRFTPEEKKERKATRELAKAKRAATIANKKLEKALIIKEKREEEELILSSPVIIVPSGPVFDEKITVPEVVRDKPKIFEPSPRQLKFLAAPEFQVLYGGAAGGGKSYALLADAARYIEYKAFNGVLIRRTLPELQELIWESHSLYEPLCLAIYGPNQKPKFSEKNAQWTFPAGGHLKFSYCETEKDVLQFQGRAYTWAGFDELTQHSTPTPWNYLASRVRSIDPNLKKMASMRAATNPGGPGHGWVKKMFIDPSPYDTRFPAQDEDDNIMLVSEGDNDFPPERWGTPIFYRRFIPAKLTDNPYLGYEYRAGLMSLPEGLRLQLLEGDWNASEGAAFPEFRRSKHVIERFEIPSSWRRFRSCDFGYSQKSASCVLWYAVDPDGTVFVYRELYVKGLTGRQLSLKIKELEGKEDISYGVLDTSCWDKRGNTGPSIAEEMISAGTRWKPSDKNREGGKNRLHELLLVDQYTSKPSILFFEQCKHVISTLEVIPVHPDGKDDTDDHFVDDHAYDSLRYGVMSRPRSTSVWETFNKGITKPRYEPVDATFGY